MHTSESEGAAAPCFEPKRRARFTLLDWARAAKRQITVFGLMFLFALLPIAFPTKVNLCVKIKVKNSIQRDGKVFKCPTNYSYTAVFLQKIEANALGGV